jgi:hypothetical protein
MCEPFRLQGKAVVFLAIKLLIAARKEFCSMEMFPLNFSASEV